MTQWPCDFWNRSLGWMGKGRQLGTGAPLHDFQGPPQVNTLSFVHRSRVTLTAPASPLAIWKLSDPEGSPSGSGASLGAVPTLWP